MSDEIRSLTALGENIVKTEALSSSNKMTDSGRHGSNRYHKSEFSIIIAATYFIPGITGRARCLQGCAPKPNPSLPCCGIAKTPRRLLPPANPRSRPYPSKRGWCPESPCNSWDVEHRSMKSLHTVTSSKVVWAETASFLRLDWERESNVGNQTIVATCTKAVKSSQVHHMRQSDICNHSLSTPTTVRSDFYSVSARTTGVCTLNQSENKQGAILHHDHNYVEDESKIMSDVRDKWTQYKCEERSSDRRSTLNDELSSIEALLARQRARIATHEPLVAPSTPTTRQGTRNKNASISTAICRAKSTRTFCKQSLQEYETDHCFRSSRNLGSSDDLTSIGLPPLIVTFRNRMPRK